MEIPTTLKHKPVIVAEDYAHIDGRTAYHTDAQGLSLGLQGDAMTVEVCTTNPKIDEDIQLFAQALSQDDELLGERFRTLARVLEEMGY